MNSKSLTKLLVSSTAKLSWSQIQIIRLFNSNKKNVNTSRMNSNTPSLKSETVTILSSVQKKEVCANGFSTSTNHNFWKTLTTNDQQQLQVPGELNAHKTEMEPLLMEGVGWAGQPIVRRTNAILPEVHGDLSDVFTAVEKLPGSSRAHEQALPFSDTNGVNKIISDRTQMQAVNLERKKGSPKHPEYVKDYLINENKTKEEIEIRKSSRSSNLVPTIGKNIKSEQQYKHPPSKEPDYVYFKPATVKGNVEGKTKGKGITKFGIISKKDKRLKKINNKNLNSGFLLSKQKNNGKKVTKVCSFKVNTPLMTKAKTKKSKKKDLSTFGVGKKRSLHPNILLSQQESTQPVRKSVLILANRQIQTHSQANQAKVSINVKEKTSATIIALGKKQKKTLKLESNYDEDCKCPETLETKTRTLTKVCGEASGSQEKKKKKALKQKMCPVEHKLKYRKRTFVCNSAKFSKAKRKRQLPKCIKPEKKIAPRVIVCPPVLEDELKKREKKCVKQVEEIKVRSRTKVCKPVIVYQKEEATVIAEKSVCIEKKVKKTISRHTKVCPPSEKNDNQKMSKP